jgi:hypothetical protein
MLQARPEAAARHRTAQRAAARAQAGRHHGTGPDTTALGRATTALGRSAGRRLHKGERHRRRVHLRHAPAAPRCSRVCDAGGRKWYTRVLTAGGRGRLGGDSVIGA